MYTTSRYVGSDRFVVLFCNGNHIVVKDATNEVVFHGHYDQCIRYLDGLEVAYQESRF